MKKEDLYKELAKFDNKAMILVNGEVIVENSDLNDDWFELSDYSDDEEIGVDYEFLKVEEIETLKKFETDTHIYETEYSHPAGCASRCNVLNIIEK